MKRSRSIKQKIMKFKQEVQMKTVEIVHRSMSPKKNKRKKGKEMNEDDGKTMQQVDIQLFDQ